MAEDRDQTLSLAFMRAHPAQAARVLELLPTDEAAVLFARAPARLGAAVLEAMLPQRAARCVAPLIDARVLELLAPMGTQPTVALLRHLPESRRKGLIAGLPTGAALASTLLLGYAEDTLGAWADPDVIALPADTLADAALDRLRQGGAVHPVVYVADAERRLTGVVAVQALLKAPAGASLATLMQRPSAVLTAHAPLSGTVAHPGWEYSSLLPVVEPGERLVGVMSRDALARALARTAPAPAPQSQAGLPTLFARAYWQTLSGLLVGSLSLLPSVSALAEKPDGR
jgi:magnesium transporter